METYRTGVPFSRIDSVVMVDPTPGHTPRTRVGVDVGGTFTDAVVIRAGRVWTAKVPTTPHDQGEGVISAVQAALAHAGIDASEVTSVAHGMTVGTNALLERRGARACLVTTAGIEDVLELRRQDRAALYRLDMHHPAPLIAADHVVGVRERLTPTGVELALTPDELTRVVDAVVAHQPEAVAVGLLFAYRDAAHEQALAEALRAALPGIPVIASSDVLPEIREYERIATTALDAYLTPLLARYLEGLAVRATAAGLPQPVIMQSSGGVTGLQQASRHAARTVLSGPAGGLVGAAAVARQHGAPLALSFDMGGTSCDVALVQHGIAAQAHGRMVAGHPVHLPMLDIDTVSAGGGSIAWADGGGALRVGPRSAGAVPGPAAYGHGGELPTVTDANVVLGRVHGTLGDDDGITLDPDRAVAAVSPLAESLGLALDACARGIIAVAVQEMVRALRVVSVERGIDPRPGVLVAFGGAGPLHACDVADELGMRHVICPASAGVLAALGMVVAGERRDHVRTVLLGAHKTTALRAAAGDLMRAAQAEIPDGRLEVHADCRYVGQSHALTVPWSPDEPSDALAQTFHDAHAHASGGAMPTRAVEVVSIRVAAVTDGPDLTWQPQPLAGGGVTGPVAIPMTGSTCWVADGWTAHPHEDGTIVMERT
jgi:N-methylhydantoinase A/oxoprolinase/acetone carboxylase beta subunit